MSCVTEIAQVINNCDLIPRSGFENIAWAFTQNDAIFTFGDLPLITNIAMLSEPVYTVRTVKKEMDAGFDFDQRDDGDEFSHFFGIQPYERDPESIANMDQMNGIVVVAELKGAKTEGCFLAFGIDVGMYRDVANWRGSAAIPVYEFGTPTGIGERYSRYVVWDTDYETTKDMLNDLTERAITTEGGEKITTEDGTILIW